MTTLERAATPVEIAQPRRAQGAYAWKWMVTTDHKVTEVIFRCPGCGQDFSARPEAMRLA